MSILHALRERVSPAKKTYRLFEDVGVPHEVTAIIYRYPFRHIVIDNFLPQAVYDSLCADFNRTLKKGLDAGPGSFTRFDLYDLYSYIPKPTLDLPYGPFFSESYFQMLEHALGRTFLRDTFSTFHHHTPNPEDNYIHDDYVYQFFADEPLTNGVNPWYKQCDPYAPSPGARPVIRGAAVIFYLNNEWHEGDGGETGIFETKHPSSLVRALAPVNNRLTAFDITPTSFHNYRACRMPARNSFAQWMFVSPEEALVRFPGSRPGGWERLKASQE